MSCACACYEPSLLFMLLPALKASYHFISPYAQHKEANQPNQNDNHATP